MTLYYLNAARSECRRVIRALERVLRIPRVDNGGDRALTSRWDAPRQTVGGLWGFKLKPFAFALLAPADQASVQDLAAPPDWQSEERWQPVVVRARFQHNALPTTAGAETLWTTSSAHDLGTQYTRADGLTWIAQPIVTLGGGAKYVIALWVKTRGSAADERALLGTVTAAMLAADTIVRAIECRDADGCWVVKGGLQGEGVLASSWPATWRLYAPGDALGAPSGDAVILGQVV